MDGFKSLPKMQCFKEGGAVKSKPVAKCYGGKMKEGGKSDKAQDKSMVKKGVKQHETALHKGEPKTELKLKTGGRAKKAAGTVKKFEKASGEYGAKKTDTDKKNIKEAKTFKPAFKKGGKVKKCAEGGQPGATEAQQKYYNKNKADAKVKEDKAMYEAVGSRGDAARKGMSKGRMDAMGNAFKKGGKAKVKKYADGGAVFSDEEKAYLGGADSTDPYILARMRSALGNKKPAPVAAPVAATPVAQETSADLDPYGAAKRETSADLDPYGAASKPVAAPVRRPPMRRPMARPETSADLDPYGVTRKETSADLDPYAAASKPGAAPFINIPPNAAGMKQYRTDAVSPIGSMFNSLFKSRSQRNKTPVS